MKKIKLIPGLLGWVETLNEFRTGRKAYARSSNCWVFGLGYFKEVTDEGITEYYILPFTKVSIFTPNSF